MNSKAIWRGDKKRNVSNFVLAASAGCALVTLVFVLFCRGPFRVEADIAYISKAALQYANQGVPFNQLRLVDPHDLSRDVDTWIFWWPPGIYALFALLLSFGFTISSAARWIMIAAAIVGTIGWTRVAVRLFPSRLAMFLSALPSLLYIVDNEMFDQFSSGDPIVFATIPWLFVLALLLHDNPAGPSSERQFLVLGIACGALYWIKFSSLFGTAALMISVGLVMIEADRSLRRVVSLGVTAIGFLAPIASLWLLNRIRGGDFLQSSIAAAVPFQDLPDAALRAGAMAILPIENGVLRLLSGHDLPLIVRVIAVVLAAIVVLAAWRGLGRGVGLLSGLLILVPLSGLAYLSWATGYHFLLDASRHAGPYWIFLQLVLIGLLVGDVKLGFGESELIQKVAIGCFAVLAGFAAYAPYVALRGGLSHLQSDRDGHTGLYYPTLSPTRSGALVDAIKAQLEVGDVIVPATYWLGMESWLAFDQRLLPLTNFYQPLVATHGRDGADYFASAPLQSSQPLRIILILTDPYSEPRVGEWNERIKGRFDQALEWARLQTPENSGTTVWSAKLSPIVNSSESLPTRAR